MAPARGTGLRCAARPPSATRKRCHASRTRLALHESTGVRARRQLLPCRLLQNCRLGCRGQHHRSGRLRPGGAQHGRRKRRGGSPHSGEGPGNAHLMLRNDQARERGGFRLRQPVRRAGKHPGGGICHSRDSPARGKRRGRAGKHKGPAGRRGGRLRTFHSKVRCPRRGSLRRLHFRRQRGNRGAQAGSPICPGRKQCRDSGRPQSGTARAGDNGRRPGRAVPRRGFFRQGERQRALTRGGKAALHIIPRAVPTRQTSPTAPWAHLPSLTSRAPRAPPAQPAGKPAPCG